MLLCMFSFGGLPKDGKSEVLVMWRWPQTRESPPLPMEPQMTIVIIVILPYHIWWHLMHWTPTGSAALMLTRLRVRMLPCTQTPHPENFIIIVFFIVIVISIIIITSSQTPHHTMAGGQAGIYFHVCNSLGKSIQMSGLTISTWKTLIDIKSKTLSLVNQIFWRWLLRHFAIIWWKWPFSQTQRSQALSVLIVNRPTPTAGHTNKLDYQTTSHLKSYLRDKEYTDVQKIEGWVEHWGTGLDGGSWGRLSGVWGWVWGSTMGNPSVSGRLL